MSQTTNQHGDDDLDALMEEYASEAAIRSAKRDKEEEDVEDVGTLAKGFPDPQRELDLHGFSVPEALLEVSYFISQAITNRIRTVRIITGKGLHSKNMISVLPEEIEKKLASLKRERKILTFKRERTGGSFAVYLIS